MITTRTAMALNITILQWWWHSFYEHVSNDNKTTVTFIISSSLAFARHARLWVGQRISSKPIADHWVCLGPWKRRPPQTWGPTKEHPLRVSVVCCGLLWSYDLTFLVNQQLLSKVMCLDWRNRRESQCVSISNSWKGPSAKYHLGCFWEASGILSTSYTSQRLNKIATQLASSPCGFFKLRPPKTIGVAAFGAMISLDEDHEDAMSRCWSCYGPWTLLNRPLEWMKDLGVLSEQDARQLNITPPPNCKNSNCPFCHLKELYPGLWTHGIWIPSRIEMWQLENPIVLSIL